MRLSDVERIWVFSPVYYDTESFLHLRDQVRACLQASSAASLRFVVIDDSAGDDPEMRRVRSDQGTTVVTPPFSLGHQRALVCGLRKLGREVGQDDIVVTMDGDGEDRPEDLLALIQELVEGPGTPRKVVLARRTRRHVGLLFRVLYFFFVLLFRSLTGTVVKTGNFAAYRGWIVRHVISHPHFDVSYSASLISLNLDVHLKPCPRGRRYAGRSKMSPMRLVRHGFGMLMPFLDRIAVRALVAFAGVFALSVGLACYGAIRALSGSAAIPLWASASIAVLLSVSMIALGHFIVLFSLYAQTHGAALRGIEDSTECDTGPGSSGEPAKAGEAVVDEQPGR